MDIQSKVYATVGHLSTHYGTRAKRSEYSQQALYAHAALALCSGEDGGPNATFVLDPKEHVAKWGFNTIYKAIAGTFHHLILLDGANEAYNPRATYLERTKNAEAYEHLYRQGFRSLNEKLTEEWDGVVLYSVPRTVSGGLIEVITLNPDYMVNDTQTAAEVYMERLEAQARGQLRSKARNITKSAGQARALQILSEVTESIEDMVPSRGIREDTYGQRLLDF
jgi:hypothetical protein